MSTVLVTDYTWDSLDRESAILADAGATLVVAETGEEAELVRLVDDADAILTCFARVTPEVVRAGRNLKVIGRYGIGTDNIAVDEATRLGIPVTNVPDYCVAEVAEHTLAVILGLVRSIALYDRNVRNGDWSLAAGAPIHRLHGRTLGLVGFGSIARAVASRASALGLRVLAHTRSAPADEVRACGAEPVSLEELTTRSDIISLHVPHTADTNRMVDAAFLAAMKPGAYLVNTARGGVVDQDALVAALDSGWLGGAGLDVFTPERIVGDHPLLQHPRVIATPHVAFYSEESIAELATRAAENVAAILTGRRPIATVNPTVYESSRWADLDLQEHAR
ncbi:MAG TPA: C-terminal binding protein [Microbacterium sp.]|nr:C-terminal binding protein [Microbacterium sp.]